MIAPHPSSFVDYKSLYWQCLMLADQERNEVYRKGIREAIQGGEVVADLGAGSGVWGRLAADCGCGRVYMLERKKELARLCRVLNLQLAPRAGIEVMEIDAAEARLPQKVDVVISELIGGLLFDEGAVPVLKGFRDANCHAGTRFLPKEYELWAQPAFVGGPQSGATTAQWREDMDGLGVRLPGDGVYWSEGDPEAVKVVGRPLLLFRGRLEVLSEPPTMRAEWEVGRLAKNVGGRFGVAIWFKAHFGNSIVLKTGPDSKANSWGTTFLPLVDGGERRIGRIELEVRGQKWRVSSGG